MNNDPRAGFPIGVWLFGLVVTVMLLAGSLRGFTWLYTDVPLGFASRDWPQTTGVVLVSYISTSEGSRGSEEYSLAVTYQYEVHGQVLTSNRVSFPETRTASYRDVEQQLALYPAGAAIPIFYDPDHPEIAVLHPGPDYWFMGAGGFFSLLFLVLGLFGARILINHRPFFRR